MPLHAVTCRYMLLHTATPKRRFVPRIDDGGTATEGVKSVDEEGDAFYDAEEEVAVSYSCYQCLP